MSVEKIAAVLHHSRSAGTDRLVLIGIANHEGDGGAYPAVGTLAKYANCSERTVQRSIKALVEMGELRVKVQGGGDEDWRKDRRPNRYRVLVTCPDTCDRTFNHRDLSGVTPMSPRDADGVTPEPDGVTPMTPPRGDTAMSPEPSIDNRPLEPNPPTPQTLTLVPVSAAQTCVERVFAEWQEATTKKRTVLDAKRRKLIKDALKLYPLEDVVDAVWGWRHSDFYCGINDRNTVYNDLSLLLRNAESIERFRDLRRGDVLRPPSVKEYRDQQLMARIRADQALGF